MSTINNAFDSLVNEENAAQHDIAELLKKQITKSSPEFVSIEYTNKAGEHSRQVINIGVTYERILEKSLNELNSLDVDELKKEAQAKGIDPILIDEAKSAVEVSISTSLSKPEQVEVEDVSHYAKLHNGIKVHLGTGEVYLNGVVRSKVVLTPGTYKEVKSRPLTIAKDIIKNKLTMSDYRQFKLTPEQVHAVTSEGQTLIIE